MRAIYCAGELGRTVLDSVIRHPDTRDDLLFLDDDEAVVSTTVGGVRVRHGKDGLNALDPHDVKMLVAYGAETETRLAIAEKVRASGFEFFTVIDAEATVSDAAVVSDGVYVNAQSYVGPGANLGSHVVVDSSCVVSHDVELGEGTLVTPGATLAGRASTERGVYIGPGATVLRDVWIGNEAVVGAGAVVTDDVSPGETVVGVPASPL